MTDARSQWDKVWRKGPSSGLRRALLPAGSPTNYFLRSWLGRNLDLRGKTVLEVGGTGSLGVLLAGRCREYSLLDYSEEAAAQAERALRGITNARVVHADLFSYEPAEAFDLVLSVGLIEHFFGTERDACFRQHVRLSRGWVCVGAPSDIPTNWWRHFRFAGTGAYPDQRPVSERDLFDLAVESGLHPLAMTRLDPHYGRIRNRAVRLAWSWAAAVLPLGGYGVDRPDGGVVAMLARRQCDAPGTPPARS